MKNSPVWIAGVGVVSGAGTDVPETLESFYHGRRSPAAGLPFESSISCPTFQVKAALPELAGRRNNSRSLRLAMYAVKQAMGNAGIESFELGVRVGICMGTTVASQLNSVPFYDAYRRQPPAPDLGPVYDYLNANLGQAIGDLLKVTGPRMTVVNACSSGTDAIGVAAAWINAGLCDVAITGGADELNRVALAGFWSLGVTSPAACKPFDRDRAGLNLGEGAGVVILESEEYARRRGRRHAFQVVGFGSACDAHHLTAPHPEGRGLDTAIQAALGQAGIEPGQIAFINAHGTATQDNDRAEAKVISRIFGSGIPFISTKGYTGHTLGAAGGVEAVFTLLGLREKWIAPSVGFENQPEDLAVSPVKERKQVDGEYAMSTSLAFGGNNAALIIRRVA